MSIDMDNLSTESSVSRCEWCGKVIERRRYCDNTHMGRMNYFRWLEREREKDKAAAKAGAVVVGSGPGPIKI